MKILILKINNLVGTGKNKYSSLKKLLKRMIKLKKKSQLLRKMITKTIKLSKSKNYYKSSKWFKNQLLKNNHQPLNQLKRDQK